VSVRDDEMQTPEDTVGEPNEPTVESLTARLAKLQTRYDKLRGEHEELEARVALRAIDPKVVQAVRAGTPDADTGFLDTKRVAKDLGLTLQTLLSRLRQLRATRALPPHLCDKIRWPKLRASDALVMEAWRQCASVAEASRRTGLSRAGVHARIAKLRVGYPDLGARPHKAVSKQARQDNLWNETQLAAWGPEQAEPSPLSSPAG
jgi:hypothetical protein